MERHQVNFQALVSTANEMVANGKGLLAIAKARAKRMSVPEVLLSSEIQALLGQLDASSGLMVTLAVTTGLRAVSSLHCVGGT
jgi:hypothetical protein